MSFPDPSRRRGPVLVTGASGHVGSNLVPELIRRGRRVRVLLHRQAESLAGLDVERVWGDLLDPAGWRRALDGVETVFHLAAVISIDGDRDGRVKSVNVDGARAVAEAALQCGVRRLIHCSSIHAFDPRPRSEPLDENRQRATGPEHSAYSRSKAAGEQVVRETIRAGLDAVILHPSAIIGPRDHAPSRTGRLYLDLYHRRLPCLVEGGFDWVDVRDVVSTAIAAERRGRRGESYLISGHWHSVAEIARIAERVTGVRAPRFTVPRWLAGLGAPAATLLDRMRGREPLFTSESIETLGWPRLTRHDKARAELGHRPRPVEESIRAVYRWFAEAGMLENGCGVAEPAGR